MRTALVSLGLALNALGCAEDPGRDLALYQDADLTGLDVNFGNLPSDPRDVGPVDGLDTSALDGSSLDTSGLEGRRNIDPRLQPGTGIEGFMALQGGETLRWEAGPQGGFHLFGALRISARVLEGLSQEARDDAVHVYELENGDGLPLARTVRAGRWMRTDDGYVVRGVLLVLEPGLSPYRVSRSPSLTYSVGVELPAESIRSSIPIRTACCD